MQKFSKIRKKIVKRRKMAPKVGEKITNITEGPIS